MRGTRSTTPKGSSEQRIIPAHAGNTSCRANVFSCPRDHPRACGEHLINNAQFDIVSGSSPRMRGTPPTWTRRVFLPGIIPAHAGNTSGYARLAIQPRDHPRACGEHWRPDHPKRYRRGSSPRMRGTQVGTLAGVSPDGIIPAHAGNTGLQAGRDYLVGDHPRACGEHPRRRASWHFSAGSSPRMRGTHHQFRRVLARDRIIPAHAGNTTIGNQLVSSSGDHPRACGEHRL